ncbi:glycoside hydrolase family 18 protein [Nocardiopsis sediminis]|uniref:chitinase n=1 Tax=Nocardiopsis sediminis TaxID=1778267 RepID=A0ABV8FLJ2_9ACTN
MSALAWPPAVRGRRLVWGAGVALTLGALLLTAFAVIADSGEDRPADTGPLRVAYFADWNVANRGYTVADIGDSGAAARLDRILWAFGDVGADGRCHVSEATGQPWELYQRRYTPDESVDGSADSYRQPLAGSLHQLRLLRERTPGLGASISLGGWNWSRYFSEAVRTEESRAALVSSCIDLWLRGDLPRLGGEPQGGPGAAAGVFNGIDLDWEWPVGGGNAHNTTHPGDRRNLTLVAEEFRRRLDALEAETGERYTLSVSLANAEAVIAAAYEPELFEHVDFATVQGYDLTGPWSDTTSPHSQLYAPEGAPDAASVDRAVQRYLALGLPPEKLVVGFPGFGRGWAGVPPQGFGRFAPAQGPAPGAYGEGTDSYADLEQRPGQRFLDPVSGGYWIYDGDQWWSYDTPEVVALKGAYVRDNGLAGMMLWNLDMDPRGELVAAMDTALRGG